MYKYFNWIVKVFSIYFIQEKNFLLLIYSENYIRNIEIYLQDCNIIVL